MMRRRRPNVGVLRAAAACAGDGESQCWRRRQLVLGWRPQGTTTRRDAAIGPPGCYDGHHWELEPSTQGAMTHVGRCNNGDAGDVATSHAGATTGTTDSWNQPPPLPATSLQSRVLPRHSRYRAGGVGTVIAGSWDDGHGMLGWL